MHSTNREASILAIAGKTKGSGFRLSSRVRRGCTVATSSPASPTSMIGKCVNFLHEHVGHKFLAGEIAKAVGFDVTAVTNVLNGYAREMRCGLKSEICSTEKPSTTRHKVRVYWVGLAEQNSNVGSIKQWLYKYGRPARPTVIAEAVGLDVSTVVSMLEEMLKTREVTRCELLLRDGHDRYEYRFVGKA